VIRERHKASPDWSLPIVCVWDRRRRLCPLKDPLLTAEESPYDALRYRISHRRTCVVVPLHRDPLVEHGLRFLLITRHGSFPSPVYPSTHALPSQLPESMGKTEVSGQVGTFVRKTTTSRGPSDHAELLSYGSVPKVVNTRGPRKDPPAARRLRQGRAGKWLYKSLVITRWRRDLGLPWRVPLATVGAS
jgi:hypothetical protein